MSEVKQRKTVAQSSPSAAPDGPPKPSGKHPLGPPKHGIFMQLLRIVAFTFYFHACVITIHASQLLGSPLYWFSKDWYYAWMAMTKQFFGLLVTNMTHSWSPTVVRVSGDKSVAGLLKQDASGMLTVDFGERAVLMANHQIYTDWLYMWWAAYTNGPPMHGHIYIILKESLKYIPVIGTGMQFYGFIFMARKWASDQARLRYRLRKLASRHSGPLAGTKGPNQLDPMWLLIFPEGTNLSRNTKRQSAKFAEKSGTTDMKHMILPRSTGLQFCLQELGGTVDYLYDCTIAYEGVPDGYVASEVFGLRSVYFMGLPPKSVNMHWRRFKVSEIPIDDHDKMYQWLIERWREKDELLEAWKQTGKFPADKSAVDIENGPKGKLKTAYINTEVRTRGTFELLTIFMPMAAAGVVARILIQIIDKTLGA